MSTDQETGVDVELLAAIQRLSRLMSSRQASSRIAAAAGADLNQQGVQILRALYRHGEQPIAGLAAVAHMDISAVSRQLRPLEEAGLVRRDHRRNRRADRPGVAHGCGQEDGEAHP